jgi:hypothetical protein
LGWQHLRKYKRSSQEKQQIQYKVQWHPVTIEKWALPIFQNDGLKVAYSKHVPRRTKLDPCCQLCWSPLSKEYTFESQIHDDMPTCDTCHRTYHWDCLIDVKACSQNEREMDKPNEHWDCPACASLSDSQKAQRLSFSEDCKMIYVEWHPKWETADMLQMHPDLDAHVQAFDLEEIPEQTEGSLDNEIDNLVNQGFEGDPHSTPDSTWLSTAGRAIRKNVTFDFQPTNPQTDIIPTWQCGIII